MEESVKDGHLRSMDVLKGIVLVFIVFVHMFMISDAATLKAAERSTVPVIIQALYLGLMVYLILSGYFYRPRGFKENMLKRLKQIAIPLFIAAVTLPLILYIYVNICGYNLPIMDYFVSFLKYLGCYAPFVPYDQYVDYPTVLFINYGPYFLAGMLWGFLIFYGLAGRVLDDWRKILATIIVLLVIQVVLVGYVPIRLPLLFKLGPLNAAFMFFGAWLAQMRFLENLEFGDKKDPKYWLIPIICFVAGVGLCYLLPPGTQYDLYIYGEHGAISVFPYYLEAILMFVPIAYIGFIFSRIPLISTFFDTCGKHTLGTILTHAFIGKVLVVAFGFTLSAVCIVPSAVPFTTCLIIAILALIIPVLMAHFGPKIFVRLKDRADASKDH